MWRSEESNTGFLGVYESKNETGPNRFMLQLPERSLASKRCLDKFRTLRPMFSTALKAAEAYALLELPRRPPHSPNQLEALPLPNQLKARLERARTRAGVAGWLFNKQQDLALLSAIEKSAIDPQAPAPYKWKALLDTPELTHYTPAQLKSRWETLAFGAS